MKVTQYKLNAPPSNSVARIARNSVFSFGARIIDIGFRVISIVLIARYLGLELFGQYAFILAIVSFLLPLSDFGIERIVVREISGDIVSADKHLSSALVIRAMLSIFLIALIILLTHIFQWDRRTVLAVYIASCSEIFISFGMIFLGVFRAFERMEYDTLISLVHQLLRIALIIVVIRYDLGFLYLFLAIAVADLLKTSLQALLILLKFFRPRLEISLSHCIMFLKESYPLAIFAFLAMASFKVDIFVLKYFRGSADISLFEVPHRIIMLFQVLPMSVVSALFPTLSRFAKTSMTSLGNTYNRAFKFLFILSIPMAILLCVWAKEIILPIFGKEYIDASAALQFLSGTICFLFMISLMNFTLTSIGKQRLTTVSVAVCFIINLTMDLILVPKYGYIGASIGTLIAYVCFFFTSFYFVSKHVSKIWMPATVYKPVLSGVFMIIVSLFFYNGTVTGSLLGGIVGILTYIISLLLLRTFSSEDMGLFNRAFRRV